MIRFVIAVNNLMALWVDEFGKNKDLEEVIKSFRVLFECIQWKLDKLYDLMELIWDRIEDLNLERFRMILSGYNAIEVKIAGFRLG
jgi:hypothetical protein